MDFREFKRLYLLKSLLAFVALQVVIIAIVQNYNHKPVAQPDQGNVIEGKTVKITPLTNDTDKDNEDKLSISQFSKSNHGKAEQKGNILYYTPEKRFTGKDSLTYIITDGHKKSRSSVIVINVNKNLEPIAKRDVAQSYNEGSILIDVTSNDSDREGDSIFIEDILQPLYGKVQEENNQLVYTVGNTSVSADSFQYTISDGKSVSEKAFVRVNIKNKNNPCYPWLSSDIGDALLPGSFIFSDNKYVIEGSGTDIWNDSDGFHFAYQYIKGDCEISAKVESLEGSNEWSKAGVMVRESLSGNSKTAFACVTTKNGITYHQRIETNAQMEGGNRNPDIKAPYWVKLVRTGNLFNYYFSEDGKSWNNLGSREFTMSSEMYIGLAVTSHNNAEKAKGVFSNLKITGKVVHP